MPIDLYKNKDEAKDSEIFFLICFSQHMYKLARASLAYCHLHITDIHKKNNLQCFQVFYIFKYSVLLICTAYLPCYKAS